jgi:hypothetical protein
VTHIWRRSSRSENDANCVELRNTLDHVRDSKNTDQALRAEVPALVRAVQANRLGSRKSVAQ